MTAPRPRRVRSLRTRLFLLIVLPLMGVALASSVGLYQFSRNMSQTLYDDTLKVVAHVVSREVMLTKGDMLTDVLLDSLVGALGDPIFYQVRAAEGHFVTGHSDAPVPDEESVDLPGGTPVFFNAVYHGRPVRAVILREFISDPDFDGWTTVQVWQTVTQREALSLTLLSQTALNLLLLVMSAAALVWFGINRGLAPLTDLRAAVSLRTANDLKPIRRPVPAEVGPLVETINNLFTRLRTELDRRNAFIGNAAHQLRNPVAAIQAQAEAALGARNDPGRTGRLRDLVESARRLSRISHQLLNFDIATEGRDAGLAPPSDFPALIADVARRHVPRALRVGVDMELEWGGDPLLVAGNRIMLEEAVDNLVDNALKYGCPQGGRLALRVGREEGEAVLTVADDGVGIAAEEAERVFDRFVRIADDDSAGGCGLGLPIVRAIAESLGGTVRLVPTEKGCTMRLSLPIAATHSADSADRIAAE